MASDPFVRLCEMFANTLTDADRTHWTWVIEQYRKGRMSQDLVARTMEEMQAPQGGTAAGGSQTSAAPAQAAAPSQPSIPKAWQTPPEAIYGGFDPWNYNWPDYWTSWPGWGWEAEGKGYVQKGKEDWSGMGYGKGKGKGKKGKGDGKNFQGKGREKGDGKGKGKGGKTREISASSLEDAERRMDRWMASHPNFVFRPREEVPERYEDVYNVLGERGPQFWKALRHHLANEDGLEVAGRVLQFMAERSTWRSDKLNHVEISRTQRRQADANSSRMSVATGYTGMSRRTAV
jgi:hypothetical protein